MRGGGVLIGVRKDIPVTSVPVIELNVEHVFVRIYSESFNFIVGGVYIPPLSPLSIYESHAHCIENLMHLFPEDIFIICGDYNLPEISWSCDDDGLTYSYTSSTRAPFITETFAANGFYQANNVLNLNNITLDLIFCTDKHLVVENSNEPLVPIDKHHPALNISLPVNTQFPSCDTSHSYFNFKKANYNSIRLFLSSFDLSLIHI